MYTENRKKWIRKMICVVCAATVLMPQTGQASVQASVQAKSSGIDTPFVPVETKEPETTKEPEVTKEPEATKEPFNTDEFAKSRISSISQSDFAKDKITVSWEKINGADGYEIWQLNRATNGYDLLTTVTDNKYVIGNLTQGTKISVMIRAYMESDQTKLYNDFSNMCNLATVPDNVTGLKVNAYSSQTISLVWDKVSEDASYVITRCAEGSNTFETVATVRTCSYQDAGLKVATGYTYVVYACVEGTDVKSENEIQVITSTSPNAAYIKQYKGGDCRARIRWDKVSAGDGYILYMKNELGQYVEIARITDIKQTEYIQTGLVPGVTYHLMLIPYRYYNNAEYKADLSNEVDIKATGTVKTSTKAKIYETRKKLRQSKLYKKYTDFSKATVLSKSTVMPGLTSTSILGFAADKMITQGMCIAGNYMLVTAYDSKNEENSVVYVLNASSRKYICTIVLPDAYHVGGIAYDGFNIWVSTGKAVSCFTILDVESSVASGQDSNPVFYKVRCPVLTQASFVTYYKNRLWIGEHKESSSSRMYGYEIDGKKTDTPSLRKTGSMLIPSRTQDVCFLKSGTMIVSRSNQLSESKSKYYISELVKYKPTWKTSGSIKKNKSKGKITMPPMMEGIAFKSKYLYVTFESANISGCPYKMDRICALKYSKIKWKK